jgi:hypothetical protein
VISIREATFEDFALFELHEKNLEEIKVSSGIEPGLCMAALYETSEYKQIVLLDNKPICISGLVDKHNLWLFFAVDVETLPLSFFKETHKGLNSLLNQCGYIEGHIYSENIFALQWAKFMKITIEEPKEYGIENKLFHYFFKRKEA